MLRRCVWSRNIKNRCSIYIYIYIYICDISRLRVNQQNSPLSTMSPSCLHQYGTNYSAYEVSMHWQSFPNPTACLWITNRLSTQVTAHNSIFVASDGLHSLLFVPTSTYLLTPYSRVLLEKLTSSQPVKKFPTICGTRRFITAFTNPRQLSLCYCYVNVQIFLFLCSCILNVMFMHSYCYVYIFLLLCLCILIVTLMFSCFYINVFLLSCLCIRIVMLISTLIFMFSILIVMFMYSYCYVNVQIFLFSCSCILIVIFMHS